MKKLRQLSMAVVLTLALSASALAGIIGTGPEAPPPPEPPSVTATGITDTPPNTVTAPVPTADPVVDIALALLQSALSLF